MISLSIFLVFIGSFALYLSSAKIELKSDWTMIHWIKKQGINTKGIGVAVLFMAIFLCIQIWGLGAGLLFFFVQLMTVGSLVILLTPLHTLNIRFVFSLATVFFIIELLTY